MKESHEQLSQREKLLLEKFIETRRSAYSRFPLLFTLLGTFGAVGTFVGLNGMIQKIDILRDNPALLFFTALAVLAVTGKLYKKLD